MKYFERRFIRDGATIQIWERRAGGKWALLIRRDEYRDQYGPYAS